MKEEVRQAIQLGAYDDEAGGHYNCGQFRHRWWTWETPAAIRKKFDSIVPSLGLGGVFAWALGEDAPQYEHLKSMTEAVGRHAG